MEIHVRCKQKAPSLLLGPPNLPIHPTETEVATFVLLFRGAHIKKIKRIHCFMLLKVKVSLMSSREELTFS